MLSVASQLAPFPGAQALRFTSCWKLTRKDGAVYRFTNHDEKLVLYDEVYYPRGTMNQSASSRSEGFDPGSRGLLGVITDDRITHEDLAAGMFRDAEIIEYLVDWKFPYAGAIETAKYWIADTEFSDHQWKGTVESVERFLQPAVGDVYGRNCRHRLGDSKCKVANIRSTGLVTIAELINARMEISVVGQFNSSFTYGYTSWTTGANVNTRQEVIEVVANPKPGGAPDETIFRFAEPTPRNMEVGDELIITEGCDRTYSTCHSQFGNTLNFGGFPHIPNRDAMLRVPGLVEEENG